MIAHIFVTALVQSNQGVWNMSGIGPELARLLRNSRRQDGMFAAFYGDSIFTLCLYLIPCYLDPDEC